MMAILILKPNTLSDNARFEGALFALEIWIHSHIGRVNTFYLFARQLESGGPLKHWTTETNVYLTSFVHLFFQFYTFGGEGDKLYV